MEIAIWIGVFLLVLISVLLMMLCVRMTYINEALDLAPQVRPVISHETRDHQELLIHTLERMQEALVRMQETMADTQGKIGEVAEELYEIHTKLIGMPTEKALHDINMRLIDMPTSKDIELAMSIALGDIERKLIDMPTSEDIERAITRALGPLHG